MDCSLTDWITAVSTAIIAVLTGATLLILYKYARDTKTIAKATAEQLEENQRPFLTLEFPGGKDPSEHREQGITRNLGKGPALNIEYTTPESPVRATRWPSPLASDGDGNIPFRLVMPARWHPQNGFIFEYSSLSGRRYRTTLKQGDLWALQTEFEEISPLSAKAKG